eukprot:2376251-Amphidinium_carterae.1
MAVQLHLPPSGDAAKGLEPGQLSDGASAQDAMPASPIVSPLPAPLVRVKPRVEFTRAANRVATKAEIDDNLMQNTIGGLR